MKKPDIPSNEATRLDTLRVLNILDTQPEERFDRLARLAKRLLGVPIALISLVDENRQWFKSCQGLAATETPRDVSFCGHAILDDDIFIVPDAARDERFWDNPLVTNDPKIRFYAGFPLKVMNGSKLGTLCVIDREPRMLDEDDLSLLRDLAKMAEQELAAVQLATLDELTLISNRRGFYALGQHALHICKRKKMPATLFLFDLDRFKQINDRYGHAEGDRALVAFSDTLRQTFRESDIIGRLGGDEFIALMTDADETASSTLLERLARNVAELNAKAQRGYDICYSVGTLPYDAERHASIDNLIKQADALMYEQKRQQRDRRAKNTAIAV